MHVLLIHDDDSLRGALTMMLRPVGVEVIPVNVDEAPGVLERRGSDVVVVDIPALPDATLDALRTLRSRWQGAMVLALVSKDLDRETREAVVRAAGSCRLLRRPLTQGQLVRAVQEAAALAEKCAPATRTPTRIGGLLDELELIGA
jgi:DNA-binding response OmpR family regulator